MEHPSALDTLHGSQFGRSWSCTVVCPGRWGYSHTWHGREVQQWWPPFLRFSIRLGPYCMPHHDLIDPFSCRKKIGLSVSHLVPEILGPKVGLIVHQNVLFNRFKAFCINFLLDFQSNWLPFSVILDLFGSSYLQNLRSDCVNFFYRVLKAGYQTFMKYPSPSPVCQFAS